ncbi:MAG: phosphatase PAP2 family protein [Bacillota bacterium]|nr:phosphatase PAP2 family protein [Bacillota bacterium]
MNKIYSLVNYCDLKLLYLINSRIKSSILDKLFPLITNLGSTAFTLLFSLSLILFGRDRVKAAGIESLFTLTTSSILVTYLKKRFTRPRPYWVIKNVNSFNLNLKDYSFPSGHTTAAFSIAAVLSINFPSMLILFTSIALIVGLSRIYLAVHFPTDVLIGIIIGISFGIFNCSVIYPYFI